MMDKEISTTKEFNDKYKDYLQEDGIGLDINHYRVIIFLDVVFKTFIELPNFKFNKIILKNRDCIFDTNIHNPFIKKMVEGEIQDIIKSR